MAETAIRCEVVYARPDSQRVVELSLPAGATARDALVQSKLCGSYPEIDIESAVLGIFGAVVPADYQMRDGDRLEIYRPLAADPRLARRARVRRR